MGNEMAGRRFTRKEIHEATGIATNTIRYRIRRLGLRATVDGYTYEDVKRLIDYRCVVQRKYDTCRVEILRKALINDGKL